MDETDIRRLRQLQDRFRQSIDEITDIPEDKHRLYTDDGNVLGVIPRDTRIERLLDFLGFNFMKWTGIRVKHVAKKIGTYDISKLKLLLSIAEYLAVDKITLKTVDDEQGFIMLEFSTDTGTFFLPPYDTDDDESFLPPYDDDWEDD